MGKAHLIGRGPKHLVPPESGKEKDARRIGKKYVPEKSGRPKKSFSAKTQHNGLPVMPDAEKGSRKPVGKNGHSPSHDGASKGKGRPPAKINTGGAKSQASKPGLSKSKPSKPGSSQSKGKR